MDQWDPRLCWNPHWGASSKWRKIGNFNSVAVAFRDLTRRSHHHGFSSIRIQNISHLNCVRCLMTSTKLSLSLLVELLTPQWAVCIRQLAGRRLLVFVQLCRLHHINLPLRCPCWLMPPKPTSRCCRVRNWELWRCCQVLHYAPLEMLAHLCWRVLCYIMLTQMQRHTHTSSTLSGNLIGVHSGIWRPL